LGSPKNSGGLGYLQQDNSAGDEWEKIKQKVTHPGGNGGKKDTKKGKSKGTRGGGCRGSGLVEKPNGPAGSEKILTVDMSVE